MDRPRVLRFAVSSLLVTGGIGLVGATAGCKPPHTNTGPQRPEPAPNPVAVDPPPGDDSGSETPSEPAPDDSVPAPLPPEPPAGG